MEIVNKVAQSGLKVLKLDEVLPVPEPVSFDLADYLFKGLILREKDFRAALKELDWSQFEGKDLALHCSADAIIPMWAWMLVSIYAAPHARSIVQSAPESALELLLLQYVDQLDVEQYAEERVIVKGCTDREMPPAVYARVAARLTPIVRSIMFGEPCSTVPLYKKKK